MSVRAALILAAALVAVVTPAAAQAPRTPDQRQVLLDLAYVLGEAHGLRAACAGADDQTWRSRMTRLLEVEAPEEAFRRRLVDGFNSGFLNRQAQNPACRPGTAAEEQAAARRGGELARRLAGDGP